MLPAARLLLLFAVTATAATAALSGCGGDDPEPAASTTPSGAATSSSSEPSNTQDAARVKLIQCLRDQGVDVPDTTGQNFFAQMTPAQRQQAQVAIQGPCNKYQSEAFGDAADPQSQEFLDAITSFTVCMRKQDVKVPDPDPTNPFSVLHSLDQSNPRIAAALSKCQDKLAAINGG